MWRRTLGKITPYAWEAAIAACLVWAIHHHATRSTRAVEQLASELGNFHATHREKVAYLRGQLVANQHVTADVPDPLKTR